MPDPLDIYGKGELVNVLGVSRERVRQLQQTDPSFPKPREIGTPGEATRPQLICGPIYDGPETRQYAANRPRGT